MTLLYQQVSLSAKPFHQRKNVFELYVYVCVCVQMCACACRCQQILEALDSPGGRVTGNCEPPDMGAGSRNWVLFKNSSDFNH